MWGAIFPDKAKKWCFCILSITQDEPTSSTAPWAARRCCRSVCRATSQRSSSSIEWSGISVESSQTWFIDVHVVLFLSRLWRFLSCPENECSKCAILTPSDDVPLPAIICVAGCLKRPSIWLRIHVIHVGSRLFVSSGVSGSWLIPIWGGCLLSTIQINSDDSCQLVLHSSKGTLQYVLYHCGFVVCPKNIDQISQKYIFWHVPTSSDPQTICRQWTFHQFDPPAVYPLLPSISPTRHWNILYVRPSDCPILDSRWWWVFLFTGPFTDYQMSRKRTISIIIIITTIVRIT